MFGEPPQQDAWDSDGTLTPPRRQRRPRQPRADAAGHAPPPGPPALCHRQPCHFHLDRRRPRRRLSLPRRTAGTVRDPARRHCRHRRRDQRHRGAGDLLLRARPHVPPLAGPAPGRRDHGRGGDAAGATGDHCARADRVGRPSDPPRGRRHGRRGRARARPRGRAGIAGAQRSLRARARLQRQRSAHPRPAQRIDQPAREPGQPGRARAQRHRQRAPRSLARHHLGRRSGRRQGQRRGAARHPFAHREGRAHHDGARSCRRQHDRHADRSRLDFARPAGDHRRPRQHRHLLGQRPAHQQPQFQGRARPRRVRRPCRPPAADDDRPARPGRAGLRAKSRRHYRKHGDPLAGLQRHPRPDRQRDDRNHRGPRRPGERHAALDRRRAGARAEPARRRRGRQTGADRRAHHRNPRQPQRRGGRHLPRKRRSPGAADHQPRRRGQGHAGRAPAGLRGHVQPWRHRAHRKGLARLHHARRPDHPPHGRVRPHRENLWRRTGGAPGPAHPGRGRSHAQLRRYVRSAGEHPHQRAHRLDRHAVRAV